MVPLRLQSLPETVWRRYTQVHTQRATSSHPPRRLVWSYFCIAIGGLYLLLMWLVWLPFEPSAFWTALHSIRGFALVALGVWIVGTSPWRATTPLERRQGQAVATLCLICAALSVAIALHDREGQQLPWRHTLYWGTSVLGLSQFYWLARQGRVRLGASLFIGSLLVFQLGNSGADVTLTPQANPYLFTLVVLCCGLFVRWWAGILAGLSLPLAVAALQASGLTVAPPDWNAAVTATLMLTAIGAMVAFFAWSLDAVMREAEGSQLALADANDQLSYALREAQSANHVKTQIVATVSHELRTPLTAILGHTDMLRAGLYGDLNDEQQHAVERAYTNSERLLRLINDLLDFSQLDGSALSIRPEEMPLHSTVQDVADMVQPAAAAKGLTLNTSFDQALPNVMLCDPLRLRQVLLKLLENAVSYTESGGITLLVRRQVGNAAQPQRDAVVFQVRDTGAGIPPRDLALIFEPFRHSSVTPPASGGSGLGLTIVQQLVQAMGGTIQVTSLMGYGSTFTVTLPLVAGGD